MKHGAHVEFYVEISAPEPEGDWSCYVRARSVRTAILLAGAEANRQGIPLSDKTIVRVEE